MSVLVEDINLVGLCRDGRVKSNDIGDITCILTYKADHYNPACLSIIYCQILPSFYSGFDDVRINSQSGRNLLLHINKTFIASHI